MNFYGYTVYEDGIVIGKRGQVMSPNNNGRGYLILGLMIDGKRKTFGVHKLVALIHIPNPLNLPEIDHIDGNKLNNHKSNLRWCTRGENIQNAYDLDKRSAKGESNSQATLTESQVHSICVLLSDGYKCCHIRDLGYPYTPVRGIKSRKNWKHISDSYNF